MLEEIDFQRIASLLEEEIDLKIIPLKQDLDELKKSSRAQLKGVNSILNHLLETEDIVSEQIEKLQKRVAKLERKNI